MKKALLMTGALIVITASAALAQTGFNAKWTDCGAGGTSSTTSACSSALNPAKNLILSWYAPPTGATQVIGYSIKVIYATPTSPKSCWWDFTQAARQAGFAILGTDNPPNCPNFLGAFGSTTATGGYADLGGNRGAFAIAAANQPGQSGDASSLPGTEFYAATLQIKAAGTGAGCLGCTDGVQLRMTDLFLSQEGGLPVIEINTPQNGANGNCATWNAGVCDAATPTKNATWGSVKALYR